VRPIHASRIVPWLVVLPLLIAAAATAEETPKQACYLIEATLTSTSPDGRKTVLCSPRLVTLEGRAASIRIGGCLTPPKGVDAQEPLATGTRCDFTISKKDGQLFLHARCNTSSGETDADGFSITTSSLRVIKAITLGKKITVPSAEKSGQWEVLIQDATSLNSQETASSRVGLHASAAASSQPH
jgi:hypothetical protein